MTMKDWLIKKISVNHATPQLIINKVISHQFESISNALVTEKSVEISDFGKFMFKPVKGERSMAKWLSQKELFTNMMEDPTLSNTIRKNAKAKLQAAVNNINHLNKKIK